MDSHVIVTSSSRHRHVVTSSSRHRHAIVTSSDDRRHVVITSSSRRHHVFDVVDVTSSLRPGPARSDRPRPLSARRPDLRLSNERYAHDSPASCDGAERHTWIKRPYASDKAPRAPTSRETLDRESSFAVWPALPEHLFLVLGLVNFIWSFNCLYSRV